MALPMIEERPGLGALIGTGLGQGLQQGIQSGSNFAMQLGLDREKLRQKNNQFQRIFGMGTDTPAVTPDAFENIMKTVNLSDRMSGFGGLPTGEELPGEASRRFSSEILQNRSEQLQPQANQKEGSVFSKMSPEQKATAALMFPQEFRSMAEGERADLASEKFKFEKEKFGKEQEFQREQKAQESIKEIRDKLKTSELSAMRFGRLGELFTPEMESKFPPAFAVGLLTKDGDLRPTAMAMLSPEAQESVKLIMDEMTGAKDTYGARVTNFDAQQYLKRLPSLLNSPEGRRRVLRDLSLINQMNQLHDREVLNIVDEYGGSGKISLEKAESIFNKRFSKEKKEIANEFIKPKDKEKKITKSLEDIFGGK